MKTNTIELKVVQAVNISETVKAYGSRLAGFIRKRVKRLEDAEDILQEVFYQLTEADRLMKPIDEISAWLFAVARNRITDLYRKKKPELMPEFYTDEDFERVGEELGELLANNGETPETEFLKTLVWEELAAALNDLPPEQREVFNLPAINFWQAAGLLILARLFFGSGPSKWHRNSTLMNPEFRNKIKNMSPEERMEFFRNMRHHRSKWHGECFDEKELKTSE